MVQPRTNAAFLPAEDALAFVDVVADSLEEITVELVTSLGR